MATDNVLKGKDIVSCHISYENLVFYDKAGNKYYLAPKNLFKFLNKQKFKVTLKRTRKHLESM